MFAPQDRYFLELAGGIPYLESVVGDDTIAASSIPPSIETVLNPERAEITL